MTDRQYAQPLFEKIPMIEEDGKITTAYQPVFGSFKIAYPWDQWKDWALADGVSDELARLGRSYLREAYNHNWCPDSYPECRWDDHGQSMIQLALTDPAEARSKWQAALDNPDRMTKAGQGISLFDPHIPKKLDETGRV